MKDIFIDTNIAKNFTNPSDNEYRKLIRWLKEYDEDDIENKDTYAHLVHSQKLMNEYIDSSREADSQTCIYALVNLMMTQGRIVPITNKDIKDFKRKHFTKKVEGDLRCNKKDRDHIPAIMLSHRKYVLAIDKNFLHDIINFPRFKVTAASRPSDLPYQD